MKTLLWWCAVGCLVAGSLAVAKEASAACGYTKGFGQFCADVTDHCAEGCASTSCAERVTLLTSPNGPVGLVTFFQGAMNRCSHAGNNTQVFECAWGIAARAYPGLTADQCTKNGLWATLDSIAFNYALRTPIDEPETCPSSLPRDGSVPAGFFALQAPKQFIEGADGVNSAGSQFNVPPAHNIGTNEGRLTDSKAFPLRRVARVANPLECSLPLASQQFALAKNEQDRELARAYADLSVTGRLAWYGGPASTSGTVPMRAATKGFRAEAPGLEYCRALPAKLKGKRPALSDASLVCPTVATDTPPEALVKGCKQALTRAYEVANYLRAGHARGKLGWIAVSGEDDQPYRPVNVPRSAFPQYDVNVDVTAPAGKISVRSRFTVAQFTPPLNLSVLGGGFGGRGRGVPPPPTPFTFAPEPTFAIAPNAEILLFIHGMDSRAEEANDITEELFTQLRAKGSTRNLTMIAVDLPTSGYADNIDYEKISSMNSLGNPGGSADFHATGDTPVLQFIEDFIVGFTEELEKKSPGAKNKIKLVMGGSLGGNMTFRLGRRDGVPWLPKFIVWSPASIWDSLAGGNDLTKHAGVRDPWGKAIDARDPNDIFALTSKNSGRRASFFGGWDKPIIPIVVPMAQSDTWQSDHYPCKRSCVNSARMDRQETYDSTFQAWHWRLATEQLIYSHQTIDARTHAPRFMSNTKRMLLVCGIEDNITGNDICGATQRTAPHMTTTPGRAIFLDKTGHSVDNERRELLAKEMLVFLDESAPAGPLPVSTPLAAPPVAGKKTLDEPCLLPSDCESNRCSGLPLRCEAQPSPAEKKPNGQLCAVPSDCQSNRCVITCQAQPEQKPNGSSCITPSECLSNRCSGFPLNCEAQPALKFNGESCLAPSECSSNRCSGLPLKCEAQPPPQTKKPNGQLCLMPSECESNRCSGLPLRCEAQPPPPPPKKGRGEGCDWPSECQSNACNFWRKCE